MDINRFDKGECFDAYKYLGAHVEGRRVIFRTYAPNATAISVIGEFNNWTEEPMSRIHDGRFWELSTTKAKAGQMYKYRIYRQDGSYIDHCDPYGFGMQLRPNNASIIRNMKKFRFGDSRWMKKRTNGKDKPMNIYEVHFGSFRKPDKDKPDSWYNYEEMIDVLIPYLIEYGYNYVELMPLSEHPSDESWGYQNTGFFAPTARYGEADQLKKFVNACHKNNIGVIMDYVPVHFAVDGYALANYDGTPIYEYPSPDVGYSEWGSCNFNHARGEVASFLNSAANYWLDEYHVDGLRMDAISRVIYWMGDERRGANQPSIDWLKRLNVGLKELHPTCILAAEDSSTYPNITKPVSEGGLGFDYKWDMGWMNDTLDYMKLDPIYRSAKYHQLTFSMFYFMNEQFLLPLSHDETVHGKLSVLDKMFGKYEDKFPQARLLYMYMYSHPGKKLNFMGNEIGTIREWDEKKEPDWFLLKYPIHDAFHRFMKDLNHFYLDHSCFSTHDYSWEGFQWLDCNQPDKTLYAYKRMDEKEQILCAFNFSGARQFGYELEVGTKVKYLRMMMASDQDIYNGDKFYDNEVIVEVYPDGKCYLDLDAFACAYYEMVMKTPEEIAADEATKKYWEDVAAYEAKKAAEEAAKKAE